MITTSCPSADELQSLSSGRLADERSDELLEHIRACESCRSKLETIADEEDSLIAALRAPDALAPFDAEPDCRLAVAKALGALAHASETAAGTDPAHLPKSIGEYEVVRPLGRGGMGSVFLARHTKLGREVALKVLASHRLADPRMRERFEAEMRAVGRLSHPNIVTAYDARDVDGTAVLVTEYIDGFNLAQLVEHIGPLTTADACEVARQVAVAVAYTSGQGFVHRDVKPSNIMLSRSGRVKLLDLGLARLQLDELEQAGVTGTGQTMGTADYVAPEQVVDSRRVDVRADIYSLGCTLFKLLTGTAPFAGREHPTAFAKMTAHVSQQPPSLAERLPGAPVDLVKLVDAMLAKDPAKRPQTPNAVVEKLTPLAQDCDLPRLIARAEAAPPVKPRKSIHSGVSSKNSARALPLLRRRIPLAVALGGGLLGLLLGLCIGLFIKIERPDGTVFNIPIPPGSKVTLEDGAGPAEVGVPKAVPTVETAANSDFAPLQFAVLVEEDRYEESLLERAEAPLAKSDGARPVTTELGTWYPVAADVRPPVEATHQDRRYALARHDPQGLIRWKEISGNAGVTIGRHGHAQSLIFSFGPELAARLREVSTNNVGRRFALILDSEIVTVARISSELSSRVTLLGNFSEKQIQYLHGAFSGLLSETMSVEPDQKVSRRKRAGGGVPAAADANGDSAASEGDAVEAFQGIWQVASVRTGDRDIDSLGTSVMAFDENRYYSSTAEYVSGAGTYTVSEERKAVDFRDDLIRETRLATLRGSYRFLSRDRLEIKRYQTPDGEPPSSSEVDDHPLVVTVLERMGDVPRTVEKAHAIAGGKDEELAQAVLRIVDAVKVPPSALRFPSFEVVESVREQNRRRDNLKRIGKAFHEFFEEFNVIPGSSNQRLGAPAAAGEKVEPFSWRVAILPFIGESDLYEEYRFHEPWDSEHNSTLLAKMPQIYRSPFREDSSPDPVGYTNYQGFAGEQAALGLDGGRSFVDFTDGLSPTLLIVETRMRVPWTKPQDMPFEKPEDAKNAVPFEDQPLNFVTADGKVHSLDPIDWDRLAKLITRNGGERVDPENETDVRSFP